jgi:hypothetical protein
LTDALATHQMAVEGDFCQHAPRLLMPALCRASRAHVPGMGQTESDRAPALPLSAALNCGAGGRAQTDDLLFTKQRSIFFSSCLVLMLGVIRHYNAEPYIVRSVSIYHILPYFYPHFYPHANGQSRPAAADVVALWRITRKASPCDKLVVARGGRWSYNGVEQPRVAARQVNNAPSERLLTGSQELLVGGAFLSFKNSRYRPA